MRCMTKSVQPIVQKCQPVSRHALTSLPGRSAPRCGRHAPCLQPSAVTPLSGLHLQSSRTVRCTAIAPRTFKLDSSLMWGDIMTLTTTELASERLPKHMTGVLALTMIAAWLALLFVPTAMTMYAALVSHHLLDSAVFKVPPGARMSPEGEVMLAALFTLMSWRGIYASQMLW